MVRRMLGFGLQPGVRYVGRLGDGEGAYADSSAASWRAVAWLARARAAAVVAGRGGMVALVLVSEREARSGGGGVPRVVGRV